MPEGDGGSTKKQPPRRGRLTERERESHSNCQCQQGLGLAFCVCKYWLLFSRLQGEAEGVFVALCSGSGAERQDASHGWACESLLLSS